MQRTALLGVLLVCLIGATAASAKEDPKTGASTSKTDEAPLIGKGGKGVADVKYQCEETVTAKAELSVKCTFKNTSKKTTKRFVVCMMLDLKKAKQKPVPGLDQKDKHNYVLEPDKDNPKVLKCVKADKPSTPGHGSDTSYHLGCHLIVLKPGASMSFTWEGAAPFMAPPKTKVQANDFWINYADTINLENLPDVTLDEDSCKEIVGQGQFLEPLAKKPVESVVANWVVVESAFKDPVLGYQATTLGAPDDLEYQPLGVWPCAPRNLPETSPPQGTCPRPPPSPPTTKVDLNLYWFESAAEKPSETYPAVLRVIERGHTKGVRLLADPKPGKRFRIPGGGRRFGSIRPCSSARRKRCVAPDVPEGARTTFEVDVLDAKTHKTLFAEFGTFVQDTRPPVVDSVVVTPSPAGGSAVSVHAVDATTSPIAATLWFSVDGGASWQPVGLQPTSDVLGPARARTFTGAFAPPPGAGARYYVVVQDELYNDEWYGPGTAPPAQLPPPPPPPQPPPPPPPPTFGLSVTTFGNGSGTVVSNPAGISCPITCSAVFAAGTVVALTASANPGSTFQQWGGDCTGVTGTQCSLTIDRARNATALFLG